MFANVSFRKSVPPHNNIEIRLSVPLSVIVDVLDDVTGSDNVQVVVAVNTASVAFVMVLEAALVSYELLMVRFAMVLSTLLCSIP